MQGSDRYVVSLSIHGVISLVSTYRRCMRDCVVIGPRAVDCIVGLVRDLGIWPIGRLITCALHMSIRLFVAMCKGIGPLV